MCPKVLLPRELQLLQRELVQSLPWWSTSLLLLVLELMPVQQLGSELGRVQD
jgi:hypothetical protein